MRGAVATRRHISDLIEYLHANRHAQPVISCPSLRGHEGFLEIQIVGLAVLRRDTGPIGHLYSIALRFDLRLADKVEAPADVPPVRDLGESPDPVASFAIGIGCVLDEFECASIGYSVDVDPNAAR